MKNKLIKTFTIIFSFCSSLTDFADPGSNLPTEVWKQQMLSQRR